MEPAIRSRTSMKIGVVLLLTENQWLGRTPRYAEVRELALQAEAAGFDSIWLYDHLLYRPEGSTTIGIWECWTILAALAEATRRIELGTLVLCVPFRNPAILAKMATTLDEVCNGRFTLGVGAGWNQPEFEAFGLPFDHKVDRFAEALQIMRPLLREGIVDFAGTYYQARTCELRPRGPTPDGPPFLIGASGPRMLRLTARYAEVWNTGYATNPESLAELRTEMETACAEVGRDPATLAITTTLMVAYPDLADPPKFMDSYLSDTEAIVEALDAFESAGLAHVMIHCAPNNQTSLARLAEALNQYRGRRAAR